MTVSEILSVVAIGMSSIALTWQIVSWRRTGAVVKVVAKRGFVPGLDGMFVVIEASNSGRTAVTVTGYGLRSPGGNNLIQLDRLPLSAEIPHRLESGAEVSWLMPMGNVQQTCAEQGIRHQDLVAWVRLGNGRTVTARRRGVGVR
ncbi:hypothetical protein [Actinoplanes sp. N902-109]|uniref:hypothetical protein n=1 Tax=Actinoplanes sp. (strain N902-109) TaxID=649831 RepID=UPI0003294254|nr:hypothetical protein [Actinoplanes sp. N902-109]AGL20931.1 hypothetical protein L083_7421 [Actinoplanes sp. N902-109]